MNKLKLILGVLFLAVLVIPMGVNAQTVADVANTVNDQIKGVPKLIGAICYIAGVALGVMSALKLKEHNETKGQMKLFVPIAYFVGSALLLAIPTVMNVGMGTFGFSKTTKYGSNY